MVIKMSARAKKLKKSVITGIILIALFSSMVTPSNAKLLSLNVGLINLSSLVDISWTNISQPIVPRGKPAKLQLAVEYDVSRGGIIPGAADFAFRIYSGERIDVKLSIVEKPSWADISLSTYDVDFIIGNQIPMTKKVEMTITLDEDAPAYLQGKITIKASVGTLDKIFVPALRGFEKSFDLIFTPEYLPLVNPQVAGPNRQKIGPMDTAVFPIEVENMGNERTTVFFAVKNLTGEWKAIVTDSVTIDVGQKSTVYLTIQPPRGFGYHYDVETFTISVIPKRATDLSNTGPARIVTVQVESQGVSLIGGEIILPPIIIAAAVIIGIAYYLNQKKLKK